MKVPRRFVETLQLIGGSIGCLLPWAALGFFFIISFRCSIIQRDRDRPEEERLARKEIQLTEKIVEYGFEEVTIDGIEYWMKAEGTPIYKEFFELSATRDINVLWLEGLHGMRKVELYENTMYVDYAANPFSEDRVLELVAKGMAKYLSQYRSSEFTYVYFTTDDGNTELVKQTYSVTLGWNPGFLRKVPVGLKNIGRRIVGFFAASTWKDLTPALHWRRYKAARALQDAGP